MNLKDFFTREKSNDGKKIFLTDPRTGLATGEWIRVRGVDSDAYRSAETERMRAAGKALRDAPPSEKSNPQKYVESLLESGKTKVLSSLISEWSFCEECTSENVTRLLIEAPQIRDVVEEVCSNRQLFFSEESDSSVTSQSTSSG